MTRGGGGGGRARREGGGLSAFNRWLSKPAVIRTITGRMTDFHDSRDALLPEEPVI